ncbi:hypothetical protein PM082_013624 [Marasmius tenuissimus]|nr:hypothetical protein PM082_013624 [Marasmius tenuissimus]
MSGSSLMVLFLSEWDQILIYGFNTVLFSIGMHLLLKRKARDGTVFQAVSSTVVFALATMSVVLGISATVAGLSISSAPPKIDVRACSTIQFIALHLIDFTVFMILVYRCFNVWGRSWKIIAAPLVAITAETGMYYAGLPNYVELNDATGLQEQGSIEILKQSMVFTTAALAFGAFAHTLLTVMIAGRIWWVKRQLLHLVAPENRVADSSLRKYDSVIAMTVESGMIIPIFEVICTTFNVLAATEGTSRNVTMIISSMGPQIIAFAPLLIMVRVGLGLTIERDHVSGLSFLNTSSSLPHLLDTTPREVRISVVARPDNEIELDLRGRKSPPIDSQPGN